MCIGLFFLPIHLSNTNYTTLKNTLSPNLLNEDSFFKVAKQKGYLNAVRGGKFILSKGMNNNEIINVLRSKPSTISLSFNNQERLEDLALRVSDQIEADAETLIAMCEKRRNKYDSVVILSFEDFKQFIKK